jgi:hypothetical protein
VDLTSLSERSLNQTLLSLTHSGQFSAAERLRLKIISNGLSIHPQTEYSNIALACLRNRRLTGASGFKLDEYVTWLQLLPDREMLRPKKKSPFSAIVDDLTSRGLIPKFYPFLTSTAVVLASKGYTSHHLLALARPLLINLSSSRSLASTPLLSIESYAITYEELHGLPSTPIARYTRRLLIQLFLERGWLAESVDLLLQDREFHFDDDVYRIVVQSMDQTGRKKRKEEVMNKWEKDTTTT